MHNKFIESMNKIADIYQVARLKHEHIGFPYPDEMRIFVPDLHLISDDRDEEFKYSTSYPDLLLKMMQELINLKNEMRQQGKKVHVYQLGDFIDLWRETPYGWPSDRWNAAISQILDDKYPVISYFLDSSLSTNFVLGNHDFDLYHNNLFGHVGQKHFFPLNDPKAIVFHGDIIDLKEIVLPNPLQYLAVNVLGPLANPSEGDLGIIKNARIQAHRNKDYENSIQQKTVPLGNISNLEKINQTETFNVKKIGAASKKELEYLSEAKALVNKINQRHDTDLRMAFMGHSHHARIAVDETEGQFFALIDCGGWINNCTGKFEQEGEEQELEMENAQIGVLSNNDVRIYQLKPKNT